MKVHDLILPEAIEALIADAVWSPADTPQGFLKNLGEACAKKISPDDDQLILMAPPFHTIQDEVDGGNEWWVSGLTNPTEIDYSQAVIIADFGAGSDSPIILHYQHEQEPVVMYLKWTYHDQDVKHSWVKSHESFEQFACEMGLL